MSKRYIITGAPGTGKSSLLLQLQKEGIHCFSELSRKVIQHQQKLKGNKTPWGDILGFAELIYQKTIEELKSPVNEISFVDRGLADMTAYLTSQSYFIPGYLQHFPYKKYYKNTVFLLPPWKEIYVNDPQRPQTFKEAMRIHEHLIKTYKNLSFNIETLPKTTLTKRKEIILSLI
ncbi:AAA family ATPase [Aquimarina sp. TRL1]|uniref:AAA family ATPase n=1 Tax=Aquimarina sp. (strain TRL1) TaxID=2736252 RepID=UPI001588AECF|nr:AAA family ATPase [Aquimarina sp. TRL1]QKX07074.1 AAA family ATPase [Aquimarina sp. TRL1]